MAYFNQHTGECKLYDWIRHTLVRRDLYEHLEQLGTAETCVRAQAASNFKADGDFQAITWWLFWIAAFKWVDPNLVAALRWADQFVA